MQNHIIDFLTETVKRVPDKLAFSDGTDGKTFREVYEESRSVATYLLKNHIYRQPVLLLMKKHPDTVTTFLGVISARDYYIPIDAEMPEVRIKLIMENVNAKIMICDKETKELAKKFDYQGKIVSFDEICKTPEDPEKLLTVYRQTIDTDPIYIVFTSGSTGVPKGVTACHRSVIDYIDALSEIAGFNENTIFGNQTPMYVDACLKEILSTLKFGATTYLMPKEIFMFPVKVVEFLNEHQVNTICWVVSALTIISGFNTFKTVSPKFLHTICFASEVFPIKQFLRWKAELPNARFINLYGPTETTGVCCYYEVNREFALDEVIPIGKPFKNREIILLDDENKEANEGEICVRGTNLTLGYYNNWEKTRSAFVQNPLNPYYPEMIYRTGDIGRYNQYGELEFVSRKDYQIKHMGHRIELGEIEINVNMLNSVEQSGCIYDEERSKIVLYYVGNMDEGTLSSLLQEKLPRYMIPNAIIKLDRMLYTANGKIDKVALKNLYQNR